MRLPACSLVAVRTKSTGASRRTPVNRQKTRLQTQALPDGMSDEPKKRSRKRIGWELAILVAYPLSWLLVTIVTASATTNAPKIQRNRFQVCGFLTGLLAFGSSLMPSRLRWPHCFLGSCEYAARRSDSSNQAASRVWDLCPQSRVISPKERGGLGCLCRRESEFLLHGRILQQPEVERFGTIVTCANRQDTCNPENAHYGETASCVHRLGLLIGDLAVFGRRNRSIQSSP